MVIRYGAAVTAFGVEVRVRELRENVRAAEGWVRQVRAL